MVTKAEIISINRAGNKCTVHMPLFDSASESSKVVAEALVSITPGLFNNLFVGDVVFVAFEENALEKPIIIGKLFKNASNENNTIGGAGILDTLRVKSAATIPASTLYNFPSNIEINYKDLNTPKKTADYIKWLEKLFKKLISQLDEHFRCFKNWTQWQLRPENIVVDDGDIDIANHPIGLDKYFTEGARCLVCENQCTKEKVRRYLIVDTNKDYPNI